MGDDGCGQSLVLWTYGDEMDGEIDHTRIFKAFKGESFSQSTNSIFLDRAQTQLLLHSGSQVSKKVLTHMTEVLGNVLDLWRTYCRTKGINSSLSLIL